MKKEAILFCLLPLMAQTRQFDVVVYGGTAGGAAAAVSAAREGLKVALLEPTAHIGGMVSGGLSFTDVGRREVIGGLALELYARVGRHYQIGRYGQEVAWQHEPHVGEKLLRDMLREAGVTLFEKTQVKEKGGVVTDGARVVALLDEKGARYEARIFIDSSYEGDVMAQTKVEWTYGRESSAQYGESLAGVRDETPFHQFLVDVNPKDAQGRLLPEITSVQLPAPGTADKAVQAYNYRMCFSNVPAGRVAFTAPAGYQRARYELFARLLAERTKKDGKVPDLKTVIKIDPLPNGKADINNQGAFSTDYLGGSWTFPTASYAERVKIWQAHKDYIQGFFYYLATDEAVPAALRAQMNQWGLCKDEFTDNANWPTQLYIREGRRMVGDFVMSQKDLQTELTKPDVIGMGSYNSDSHNVQRIVDARGFARNEGDMQVAVKPYQIPYRVMVPKRAQAENLLVPVTFSATHVAYSSVRMEPQYMIIGQAAGVAAKMAIEKKTAVQDVDTTALTARLRALGAVMEYVPSSEKANYERVTGRRK